MSYVFFVVYRTMVTLPQSIFNPIVAEIVRWNDVMRNISMQPNQLQVNQGV